MKKVRCIKVEGSNLGKITKGKIYDVLGESSSRYVIIDDNGDKIERLKARFEVVKNNNEKPKLKVKCTIGYGEQLTKNKVYEVFHERLGMYTIENDLGLKEEWHKSRFEAYKGEEDYKIMVTCIDPGFGVQLTLGKQYEVVEENERTISVVDNNGEITSWAASRFSHRLEECSDEVIRKTFEKKRKEKVVNKTITPEEITKKIKHGDFLKINDEWFIYYGDFLVPMAGNRVPETQSLKKILENKKNKVKVIFVTQVTYPTSNYIPDFVTNQAANEDYFTEFIFEVTTPNPRKKALEETLKKLEQRLKDVQKELSKLDQ